MPAAPLVGAVTTRPPAAFSSLTASAYRFTQSSTCSGSRSAASGFAQSWRCRSAARRLTLKPPGNVPSVRAPRDAGLHHVPDLEQAGVDLGIAAPVAFVATHQLRDAAAVRAGLREEIGAAAKRMCEHGHVGRDHLL